MRSVMRSVSRSSISCSYLCLTNVFKHDTRRRREAAPSANQNPHPIHKLPHDVLARVFSQATVDEDNNTLLSISHTWRYWRSLTLALPTLWWNCIYTTLIPFNRETPLSEEDMKVQDNKLDYFRTWIARSKNAVIRISFQLSSPMTWGFDLHTVDRRGAGKTDPVRIYPPHVGFLRDIIAKNLPRVRHLDLSEVDLEPLLPLPNTENIQYITIDTDNPCICKDSGIYEPPRVARTLFGSIPRARCLRICGEPVDTTQFMSSLSTAVRLTHLEFVPYGRGNIGCFHPNEEEGVGIGLTTSQVLCILRSCPNLQILRIHDIRDSSPPLPHGGVFPKMQHVLFGCQRYHSLDRLVSLCTFPNARSLEYCTSFEHEPSMEMNIVPYPFEMKALEHVTFHCVPSSLIWKVIAAAPILTTIRLFGCGMPVNATNVSVSDLSVMLGPLILNLENWRQGQAVLAPGLKAIALAGVYWAEGFELLRRYLLGRRQRGLGLPRAMFDDILCPDRTRSSRSKSDPPPPWKAEESRLRKAGFPVEGLNAEACDIADKGVLWDNVYGNLTVGDSDSHRALQRCNQDIYRQFGPDRE
ncbi:uncharacterized protein EI90DRAFT_314062 [Cantharellus anzutake]|uniref:uncharacterized protein n=1 Tax=Cantharellus anzutake TaxID=1750568 RepID=UPI00190610F3|nr:uncharacterized protein EI90DRAFT_1336561 [Cantharellus anzutake]XP_038918517.1 uncharacterized protein EI90DRAFT_314062 [Cantharellus anzutake]KAF8329702.1 hypothetical protein EI90DRAFT_1336561 [Cantharellus anzutake]KAF8335294.1 hypothetical protein EI90DRAFT_314062 [Cantharellus anzutake]